MRKFGGLFSDFFFNLQRIFISGGEIMFVLLFKHKFLLYLLRSVLSYPGMLHHFNFIIVYTSIVWILWSQDACRLFITSSSFPEVKKKTQFCVYVIYTRIDVCACKGTVHIHQHTHTYKHTHIR